ncbi:MAG: winged helix-turn-helix transcriptional regulator [Chlorobi bacterium]|nr:winged helix-turn-helix transcriptional regulator [Chlorobiota bacterium]
MSCYRLYADTVQIMNCKKQIRDLEQQIDKISRAFNLAGNEVRFRILFLIRNEGRLCVCDLSDILEMKIPAVSQHLRKLKDAGILQTTREAQTIYYTLTEKYKGFFEPYFSVLHQKSGALFSIG